MATHQNGEWSLDATHNSSRQAKKTTGLDEQPFLCKRMCASLFCVWHTGHPSRSYQAVSLLFQNPSQQQQAVDVDATMEDLSKL